MATVIFVHGTGVREPSYGEQFAQVERELRARQPGIEVIACPWGDLVGYRLHANGASIPEYLPSADGVVLGGVDEETGLTPAEFEAALWGLLYGDPLGELRLLALKSEEMPEDFPTRSAASVELEAGVARLSATGPSPALRDLLTAAGLLVTFGSGLALLQADPVYEQALWAVAEDELVEGRAAFARAILATAMDQAKQQPTLPPIFFDAPLRDQIVALLNVELGAGEADVLGWFDPLKQRGVTLVAQMLTKQLRQRRGPVMDKTLSFIGDILLYQGQGATVRQLIRDKVEQAKAPVVLLAHSLGGIACVDLLIGEDLARKVVLLVTAGSQAPVFYEIGALSSLRYDATAKLPDSMPPWLNIYDHQDFLSFVGARLFPGRVKDMLVDNRQPFPYAHSAYWNNPAVWELVIDALADPRAILSGA